MHRATVGSYGGCVSYERGTHVGLLARGGGGLGLATALWPGLGLGFTVWGLGFLVWGLKFGVWGFWFGV